MATKLFVNLPVKDLKRSIEFFTRLGFAFNPRFTDEKATCMIIGDDIFAMLLVEERFKNFTTKEICDSSTHTEAILALSADSRQRVDEMLANAIAAGGSEPREPEDHGWMYGRSFQDVDGHLWEIFSMDENAANQG